jgi:hypothetical protein
MKKKVYSVAEYIAMNDAIRNATARIKNGKLEYLHNDRWIKPQEFTRYNPTPVYTKKPAPIV